MLVSFIEFCLASCNDEVLNIPVIFLAPGIIFVDISAHVRASS